MIKYTEDTLMVQPLDTEKILAYVSTFLPALPEDTKYRTNCADAFILKHAICLDADCCWGILSEDATFHDGIMQGTAICAIGTSREYIQEENGLKGWCNKSNLFRIPLGIITQVPNLVKDPISLREFMGRRYDYNPRIKTNMRTFLRDVSTIENAANSDAPERSVATGAATIYKP